MRKRVKAKKNGLHIYSVTKKLKIPPCSFWPFSNSCQDSAQQVTEVENKEATHYKIEIRSNIFWYFEISQ